MKKIDKVKGIVFGQYFARCLCGKEKKCEICDQNSLYNRLLRDLRKVIYEREERDSD